MAVPHAFSSKNDVRQLLETAYAFSKASSFIGEEKIRAQDGTDALTHYYYNGKMLKIDTVANYRKLPAARVIDFEGNRQWKWYKGTFGGADRDVVFQNNFLNGYYLWEKIRGMLEPARFEKGQYVVQDGDYEGIPCWKVFVRYPTDTASIMSAPIVHFEWHDVEMNYPETANLTHHKITPQEYSEFKKDFDRTYFAASMLLIGKEKPFIYGMRNFFQDGTPYEPGLHCFGTVTFTDKFPKHCFDIPSANRLLVSNNYTEAGNHLFSVYDGPYLMSPSRSQRWSRFWSGWREKWRLRAKHASESMTDWVFGSGIRVFNFFAIASLGAIGVMKYREKRKK